MLSDVISSPARLYGRRIEVIEMTRKLGQFGDYPMVEAQFQEVM